MRDVQDTLRFQRPATVVSPILASTCATSGGRFGTLWSFPSVPNVLADMLRE